jgi:lysophospholipase L1-like esterase
MGDSLMNELEIYDILNSNNLITQVSASLYHLNDNVGKISAMNPEILILHYGLNHVENVSNQPARFIKLYTDIVAEINERLPDTRIIVSGIFPVDNEKARAKRFGRINDYNEAIIEMCSQLGVEYLDNTDAFLNAKEYYAGDGIHLSREFYEKCWLRHIVAEKEIYR